MDDGSSLPLIIAVLLLFCAMFCAVTEISFSSASRARLKVMEDAGNKKAEKAIYILDNFDKAISTILIMTNIVHLSMATLVTVAVTNRWGVSAVSISTIITSLVLFFAGEMLPKSIAKKYPERTAMFCASPLRFFMVILAPLSALLSAIGVAASKLIKGEPEISVTEDELYDIIEDMTEEGTLDEEQSDLISSALQFNSLTVESVLTPRVDIVAVSEDESISSILSVIKSCNHSRIPVYTGSIDNITGILQIRKFIKAYLKYGEETDLAKVMDKPFFVHMSTKIDDVLPVMTLNRQSVAVVTDNYGGTLGLLTIEDILEELVGEIWDEDDVIEESVLKIEDNVFSVDADEHVSDIFEEIGYEDPDDNEEFVGTLMGAWAYGQFSSIPKPGDSFNYHNLNVAVEDMDHNRIKRLRLTLLPEEKEGGDEQ